MKNPKQANLARLGLVSAVLGMGVWSTKAGALSSCQVRIPYHGAVEIFDFLRSNQIDKYKKIRLPTPSTTTVTLNLFQGL